ncbi:hypothetical protein FACS1894205_7090 [Alphaproteobacteria bacterium]|nr:hypothetical protein FACS1894205_7090 [Alphaproteobacteria bacterium]
MTIRDREATGARKSPQAMLFLLIFRSLTVRSSRLNVALTAIMVGAAVVSALTSLYLDITAKMSEELRAFGANMIISPAETNENSAARGTDQILLERAIRSLPEERLVGGAPFLYGLVQLDRTNAVMVGVNFSELKKISPYWQVEGDWISADFDERNAMIGRALAQSMTLSIGSPVQIRNQDTGAQTKVVIKGVIDTGDAEDDQIFVNLALAQKLLNLPGKADFAMVSIAADGKSADSIASDLHALYPSLDVRPIRKMSQTDGQILGKIDGLMALVAGIILVITTLCVNATLTAMVAERTPQIGLQKALGASNKAIIIQFLAETAAICLMGALLGLIAGFGLAQILGQAVFSDWVTFRPLVLPLTLVVCMAAALIAAILPVRRAVRVVPARVLRGE